MMNRRKHRKDEQVGRAPSSLSVSHVDSYLNLSPSPPSPALSTITLTPGRIRNIDQDMEALRASRQDNPFIQQIIASRESLIETVDEESDRASLMSKELSLNDDVDPFSLPEMHEHMIRSPPPTMWPKSPTLRVFQFPNRDDELDTKDKPKVKHPEGSQSPFRNHYHHSDRFSLLKSGPDDDSVMLMTED